MVTAVEVAGEAGAAEADGLLEAAGEARVEDLAGDEPRLLLDEGVDASRFLEGDFARRGGISHRKMHDVDDNRATEDNRGLGGQALGGRGRARQASAACMISRICTLRL